MLARLTFQQHLTKKNVAIAILCAVGLTSLHATCKVRQFLGRLPFAACDDALSLTKNVDFRNKIVLITECTSGIGQATSSAALLQTNAIIIVGVRNTEKTQKVKKEIDPENKYTENIDIMKLNLASTNQIDQCVNNFKSKYNELDRLTCNAGASLQREELKTVDGHELAFGVNHLGLFCSFSVITCVCMQICHMFFCRKSHQNLIRSYSFIIIVENGIGKCR